MQQKNKTKFDQWAESMPKEDPITPPKPSKQEDKIPTAFEKYAKEYDLEDLIEETEDEEK